MKEKVLELGNGYELVVEGDYELLDYTHIIKEGWSIDGVYKVHVRKSRSRLPKPIIRTTKR